MNRKRRVPEDEDGRNLSEAAYAVKTMARVDRREMIVVWSNRSGGRDDAVSAAIVIDSNVTLIHFIDSNFNQVIATSTEAVLDTQLNLCQREAVSNTPAVEFGGLIKRDLQPLGVASYCGVE